MKESSNEDSYMHTRVLVLSIFVIFFSSNLKSQSKYAVEDAMRSGIVMVSLDNHFTNGTALASSSVGKTIPLHLYSSAQQNAQRVINSTINEGIVTYLPVSDSSEWTSFDKEDITPLTWKWVDMQLIHADGDTSFISLRRPVWWLQQVSATAIGNTVHIELPEMGIVGHATVTAIRPNQLDSRLLNEEEKDGYTKQPITGKFKHTTTNGYSLYFENLSKPIGVTGNHRFWSLDRNNWIEASALYRGERIKSFNTDIIFKKRVKDDQIKYVYNLEVYRTHNYLVSEQSLLVHNSCWDDLAEELKQKLQDLEDIGVTTAPDNPLDAMAFRVDKGELKGIADVTIFGDGIFSGMDLEQIFENVAKWRWRKENIHTVTFRIDVSSLDEIEVKILMNHYFGEGYKTVALSEGKANYIQISSPFVKGQRPYDPDVQ